MTVLTLGEILLRLTPTEDQRFVQADRLSARYGGSEANVAVSLATHGVDSTFVTKLPSHPIGQAALNHLRRYGVDTSFIERGDGRMGIYFYEPGASQRRASVIYDRAHSTVTTLTPDELALDVLMSQVDWFHWSGITPALGDAPHRTVRAACAAAQRAGVTVSCDLNYRGKLWDEADAQRVMRPLMEQVDVCVGGRGDPGSVLGVESPPEESETMSVDEEAYAEVTRTMQEQFDFRTVALTLRENLSATRHGWSALLLDDEDGSIPYRSERYEIDLVDRIGGGDAFAAGLIYGLLEKDDSRDALEYAVAASCLKQTIPGDANLATPEEAEALAAGTASGQVNR